MSKSEFKPNEEIAAMLISLKAVGYPVSKIEKELKLSNGTISKAAKGERGLSDENLEKLKEFLFEKIPTNAPIEVKQEVVTEEGELETVIVEAKTETVVTPKGVVKIVPSKKTVATMTETMKALNKRFGEGTVMMLKDRDDAKYTVISTGSIGLDKALGIGGFPLGRIVEIFGMESSGKTTIALHALANAQLAGYKCLYIDAEAAFDEVYADSLGVDLDKLIVCQPKCGEEGLETAEKMIASGDAQVVVVDSVAALVPLAEINGEMGESKMGLHARLMSQACRKLVNVVHNQNALIIFINQIRHKIGVMFGSPETTTGGLALQFYSSMRLNVTRSTTEKNSQIDENGEKEGNLTSVKVQKNKCAAPFKTAQFNIMYGTGIDAAGEVAVLALKAGLLEGKYNPTRDKLINDADLYKKIKAQLLKA
jgi:recombination protein RecA